ncbi:MAG: Endolytic murein transglycosylase [Steroidobacteraceae bacterium]|nr:Endolytic murein transglycosylase [Steroidobacteraceae bacterium]
MRKRRVAALLVFAALAAAVAGGALWLDRAMDAPGPHVSDVRVHVYPGRSLRATLQAIASAGALRDPRAVEWYVRLTGQHVAAKAGNYDLPARATPRAILEQLHAGRVVLEQLTIVEGWTFAEMRRAVDAHPYLRHTLKDAPAAAIMQAIGHPDQNPEGRFFPDTYRFADGTTDLEIYRLAYGLLERTLAAAWAARRAGLPLRSADEALTLASIVEKETALASERPLIAGVFVARLRKGMRLQTDPTVIYGLGARFDGDLRRRDLTTDTPYNTYTRTGLPPTPIALPGRASIFAAVQPDETGALYFVASGKGDGSHVFSKTLAEHNAAVARYLARLRRR